MAKANFTIFKNNTVKLSVARLRSVEHKDEAVLEAIWVKYVASPQPLDLGTTKGINILPTPVLALHKTLEKLFVITDDCK